METVSNPQTLNVKPLDSWTLLDKEGTLKSHQQLQQEDIPLDWWQYNQLFSRYAFDKKLFGFKKTELFWFNFSNR